MCRFASATENDVSLLFETYRRCGKQFKCCVRASHFFTVLNGWCTPRRFGQSNNFCPYCDFDLYQDVGHLLTCPCFQNVCLPVLGQKSSFLTIDNLIAFRKCGVQLSNDMVGFCLIYVHVAYMGLHGVQHVSPWWHIVPSSHHIHLCWAY